ncbi:MAG: SAM-dependent DNA methyltransferase [Armatimonadetes bacterium]|nr:SAM-dependent DNA methyltransferase [Armatimonadota bacterium]
MPLHDLDNVIAEQADTLAARLRIAAARGGTEVELVIQSDAWLREFAEAAGVHWHVSPERRVVFHEKDVEGKVSARIDRLFNQVVVEFEPPGSLKASVDASVNQKAVKQVKEQIDGLVQREHWAEDRVAGVVLDGNYFIFLRRTGGRWIVESPYAVDAHSTRRFLRLLASLSREPMLPHTVVKRFGIKEIDPTVKTVQALFEAIKSPNTPRAEALFNQWKDFYGDVAGLDAQSLAKKKEIGAFVSDVLGYEMVSAEVLERLLFALYTYGALLMKLIAVVAVTPFFANRITESLAAIVELPESESQAFRERLREIESGEWFRRLGILNLCEGDFFGWYLDEWTLDIARQIKRLVTQLAAYDPSAIEQTPERVRDLMKALYHGLLPREVRHALGEYYTPDWLAERLLMQVDNAIWDDMEKAGAQAKERAYREMLPRLTATRWLDPTCGSGTFLVLILNKIKSQWRSARAISDIRGNPVLAAPTKRELLEALKKNVIGFDLNPLAVISARTNWLLSVADLMEEGEEIEIPVYLADSVALPAESQDGLFTAGVYPLPMRGIGKEFPIPSELATPNNLADLAAKLQADVSQAIPSDRFLSECETLFGLPTLAWKQARGHLRELYETLVDLESHNMNGLWAGVAKNMFMPLFEGRFDYVVGNPPWVNWESLPSEYRKTLAKVCKPYKLFPHKGFEAILGKSKDDISSMVSYVAADLYLKPKGKLGFVITQSVFKTSGAGQGFRRLRIRDDVPVQVLAVDDFSSFQPFEGATNRTATFVWQKGSETRYPMTAYYVWRKRGSKKPDFWMDWKQAQPLLQSKRFGAQPVVASDPTSAWMTAPPDTVAGLVKVLGRSDYQARAGAYSGGLNPVYWLEVLRRNADGTVDVRMMTEGAKTAVSKPHTHTIEPDLLYPLLRGRDVKKWSAYPPGNVYFLITHRPGEGLKAIPEREMDASFPRTYTYLKKYKKPLSQRKTQVVRRLMQTGPFYSMFAVGEYTFAPYKVVWAEQSSRFATAVVTSRGDRLVVPDHKLMMVPLEDEAEAHYVCALSNSSPFVLTVGCYAIGTQQDTHVLANIKLPRYDPARAAHRRLSSLSREAHAVVAGNPGRAIRVIEQEIDELAADLWGITPSEMDAIRQALMGGSAQGHQSRFAF